MIFAHTSQAIFSIETLFFALLGLVVGSFLNVVVWRLPRMRDERYGFASRATDSGRTLTLARPASHCPHCLATLKLRHMIPVLSYLFLRGKCAFCGATISRRYVTVELLSMSAAIILVLSFSWSPMLLPALALVWFLICLAFIDLERRMLPDELTLTLLWLGLLVNSFAIFTSPAAAILGAICGYGIFRALFWLFLLVAKKEGLGYGDMKLLAALGAWFGWQALPALILAASLSGLVVNLVLLGMGKIKRGEQVPFGPWLALSGGVYVISLPHGLLTQYFS